MFHHSQSYSLWDIRKQNVSFHVAFLMSLHGTWEPIFDWKFIENNKLWKIYLDVLSKHDDTNEAILITIHYVVSKRKWQVRAICKIIYIFKHFAIFWHLINTLYKGKNKTKSTKHKLSNNNNNNNNNKNTKHKIKDKEIKSIKNEININHDNGNNTK